MSARITALLPVALLAIMVFWCATLHGAASATGALAHQAVVLLFCLLTPGLRDPLDLGTSGRLVPVAVLAVVTISWWVAPLWLAARWWWSHPEMADLVGRHVAVPVPKEFDPSHPESVVLALTLDRNPALSFSLFAFRRSPWPGRLAPVVLQADKSTTPNTSHPFVPTGLQ